MHNRCNTVTRRVDGSQRTVRTRGSSATNYIVGAVEVSSCRMYPSHGDELEHRKVGHSSLRAGTWPITGSSTTRVIERSGRETVSEDHQRNSILNGAVPVAISDGSHRGFADQIRKLDNLLLDSVMYQLSFIMDVQFAHQIELVRIDRLGTYV